MIVFTSHSRPDARDEELPVLVREGFSWAACLFGALWLASGRAWIAAALNMASFLLVLTVGRLLHSAAPLLGLAVLQGFVCPDLLRWNLARRGFVPGPVVAGVGEDAALQRLLDDQPLGGAGARAG